MVQKAVDRNKNNLSLAETLFLCYAMERRFKEQQAVRSHTAAHAKVALR